MRGDARVTFDGERVLVGNQEPQRNLIVQTRAQAGWMKSLLAESSGRQFDVRPILVFPGWYVEQTEGSLRKLWVLEPKALPAFLRKEPVRLLPEGIKLAAFHLSRFIRRSERKT